MYLVSGSYANDCASPQHPVRHLREYAQLRIAMGQWQAARTAGQLWTVILTPELNALPPELKASDNRAYEPLGTVVVFQLHNHP